MSAPKAAVLNKETVHLAVTTTHRIKLTGDASIDVDSGIRMNALPQIQADGRNVLLKVHARFADILAGQPDTNSGTVDSTPRVQVTQIPFETTVESGRTVVIVGPEMNVKNDKTNRFEKQRLYVLLKPTVMAESKSQF
jgi:type II secretory pathway component GspD/PulD (secretin)